METTTLNAGKLNSIREKLMMGFAAIVLCYAFLWVAVLAAHVSHSHGSADAAVVVNSITPAVASVVPFAVLLGCIAILPVIPRTVHWWENNWNRLTVSLSCAGATLAYYGFFYQGTISNHLTHGASVPGISTAMTVLANAWLVEYIPFLTLLFSLYVISGGIVIEGSMLGRPAVNCGLIGIGTVMASFVGTTGAAMLMIRPLLRANADRKYNVHTIVFFIFTVCNTGGCLLPIGDPPLFLGFLRGVAFEWTLSLWPMWLLMNGTLIALYFALDTVLWRRESPDVKVHKGQKEKLRLKGGLNLLWLTGVVLAVATLDPSRPFPGTHWHPPLYYREVVMFAFTALSLWLTSNAFRVANSFNYDAILEVAALFLGIFVCMQPAVQMLNNYGCHLGLDAPWKYFWATGLLSSCLDNAPTYVVFFETAKTCVVPGPTVAGVSESYLIAISLGAVFLGAMTYLGNGPNLMIKAIAESQRVKMPSFFGYMIYSCAALLPAAILVTLVFLR